MTQAFPPFDQLAERHRPELLGYLVRLLGDVHGAEDVCQDTLLRAYRAYGRLKPGSNTRAWLYKIATNTAFTALKHRKRRLAHSADVDLDRLLADPPAPLDPRDQMQVIRSAVEGLPPKQRAALMLRHFQGLSYSEIAVSLGGTETAARANVYQAIRRLREALAE